MADAPVTHAETDDVETLDEDLPTAASYVLEYAWSCPDCGEVNGTEDIDCSGSVETCDDCGQRTRITS